MSSVDMTITASEQAGSGAATQRLLRWWRPMLGLALPLSLAVAWELAVRAGWSNGRLVPPPSVIGHTLWELAGSGERLWLHTRATLLRVVAGFGLGVAAGTLFGALAGYSALTRSLIDPTLQALLAPFPRSPGCRCSFYGSAFLRPPRSP